MVEALAESRRRMEFLLCGYVVLPDHGHALIWPRPPLTISRAVQSVKWQAASLLAQPETWEAGNGVAASVLGALRAARTRIGREARLHASQPGEKGLGEAPRRLALVELQQLFVGEAASGGVPNPHRLCADAGVVHGEKSPRHKSGAVATH